VPHPDVVVTVVAAVLAILAALGWRWSDRSVRLLADALERRTTQASAIIRAVEGARLSPVASSARDVVDAIKRDVRQQATRLGVEDDLQALVHQVTRDQP
jgi:hypothetical protein